MLDEFTTHFRKMNTVKCKYLEKTVQRDQNTSVQLQRDSLKNAKCQEDQGRGVWET